MNIIAAARIKIHASPFDSPENPALIYAGQPISGTLSIRTSLHWGDTESKRQKYILRYDIEERIKEWLVCGRKRGEFIARDDETFSVPLTLIALHHGELTLPKIDVKPLPLAGNGMSTSIFPNTDTHQAHGAETILVPPRIQTICQGLVRNLTQARRQTTKMSRGTRSTHIRFQL